MVLGNHLRTITQELVGTYGFVHSIANAGAAQKLHIRNRAAPTLFNRLRSNAKEMIMKGANKLMVLGALFAFGAGSADAGPCSTPSRDAGSGNVPGYTGQTIGS